MLIRYFFSQSEIVWKFCIVVAAMLWLQKKRITMTNNFFVVTTTGFMPAIPFVYLHHFQSVRLKCFWKSVLLYWFLFAVKGSRDHWYHEWFCWTRSPGSNWLTPWGYKVHGYSGRAWGCHPRKEGEYTYFNQFLGSNLNISEHELFGIFRFMVMKFSC